MDAKHLFVCDECEKSFSKKSNLQRHLRTGACKKVAKHSCPVCEASFMQKRQMISHVRKEHEKNANEVLSSHTCPKCGKVFHRESSMRLHLNNDVCGLHYKRIHSCSICYKSYTRNTLVLRHIRAKHPEAAQNKKPHRLAEVKGYHCCEESFANGREYRTHQDRVHVRKPEILCKYCGAKFRCKINMYNHEKIVHDKATGDLPKCGCMICYMPPRSVVSNVFEPYVLETTLVSKEMTKDKQEEVLLKPVEYFYCDVKCGKRFQSEFEYHKHSEYCWVKKRNTKKAREWNKKKFQRIQEQFK